MCVSVGIKDTQKERTNVMFSVSQNVKSCVIQAVTQKNPSDIIALINL